MTVLKPSDVFVPATIPLEDSTVYSSRDEEEALTDYADEGIVAVVFGDFGVGKTTLVRRVFRDADRDGRLVYLQAEHDTTYANLTQEVFGQFATLKEKATRHTHGETGELRAFVGKSSADNRYETLYEPLATQTTLAEVIETLEAKNAVLVVDEIHEASKEFRTALVRLVKAARTNGSAAPTIVFVGTSEDSHLLGDLDKGASRLIAEVPIKLLTPDQIGYIVDAGFPKLGMTVDEAVRSRIVAMSAGAPAIAQRLCLEAAKDCLRTGSTRVSPPNLVAAIHKYTHSQQIALTRQYARSIERQGSSRYRKQILRAMAQSSNDDVATEEISSRVSEQLGRPVVANALSGPLRMLKTGDKPILKDVYRDESREHALSRFTNPVMKSYIRFLLAAGEAVILDLIDAEGDPSPEQTNEA